MRNNNQYSFQNAQFQQGLKLKLCSSAAGRRNDCQV